MLQYLGTEYGIALPVADSFNLMYAWDECDARASLFNVNAAILRNRSSSLHKTPEWHGAAADIQHSPAGIRLKARNQLPV